jgi:hypothetical protein
MLGRIIVFQQLGHATLEIYDAVGIGVCLAEEVDDALGMGLAGVFALENGRKIFDSHGV